MNDAITKREVPHCISTGCDGLVKPEIVFFGEALPEDFHKNRSLPSSADLCIVMGTSLTVQPFASLPGFCADGVPRLLINSERVGGLGTRADDVLFLSDCDSGVRALAAALGWTEQLEALWEDTRPIDHDVSAEPAKSKDKALEDEIVALTRDIDKCLKLSDERVVQMQDQLK